MDAGPPKLPRTTSLNENRDWSMPSFCMYEAMTKGLLS